MQNPPPYQQYGAPPQQDPSGGKGPLGLEPNIAAMLCYAPCCIGLIFSIIAIITEKSNRFIKFNMWQGLFLYLVQIAVIIVWEILTFVLAAVTKGVGGLIGLVLYPIMFVFLIVHIMWMIKANGGQMAKLPAIGDLAEKQAG